MKVFGLSTSGKRPFYIPIVSGNYEFYLPVEKKRLNLLKFSVSVVLFILIIRAPRLDLWVLKHIFWTLYNWVSYLLGSKCLHWSIEMTQWSKLKCQINSFKLYLYIFISPNKFGKYSIYQFIHINIIK